MRTRAVRSCLLALVLSAACATAVSALGVKEGKLYDAPRAEAAEPIPIVPGESVGPVAFDMTKEQVFKLLGNPDTVYYGDTRFSLRDKPMAAYYVFRSAGLSILFQWEQMAGIWILSEQYELRGGIRVGMDVSRAVEEYGRANWSGSMTWGTHGPFTFQTVYHGGESGYRMYPYYGQSLSLKVDTGTNRILAVRVAPPGGDIGYFWFSAEFEEPVSAEDSRAMRALDLQAFAELGIPLDRYGLALSTSTTEFVGDNPPPGSAIQYRSYFLKTATQAEIAAQEASFIGAIDSFDATGPTMRELVSRFGLPPSASVTSWSGDWIRTVSYGDTELTINQYRYALESIRFSRDTAYRYKGRIGTGSTMEEVYAELGEPLGTIVYDESLSDIPDRVLLTREGDGTGSAEIRYRDMGIGFSFSDGRVSYLDRFWNR